MRWKQKRLQNPRRKKWNFHFFGVLRRRECMSEFVCESNKKGYKIIIFKAAA